MSKTRTDRSSGKPEKKIYYLSNGPDGRQRLRAAKEGTTTATLDSDQQKQAAAATHLFLQLLKNHYGPDVHDQLVGSDQYKQLLIQKRLDGHSASSLIKKAEKLANGFLHHNEGLVTAQLVKSEDLLPPLDPEDEVLACSLLQMRCMIASSFNQTKLTSENVLAEKQRVLVHLENLTPDQRQTMREELQHLKGAYALLLKDLARGEINVAHLLLMTERLAHPSTPPPLDSENDLRDLHGLSQSTVHVWGLNVSDMIACLTHQIWTELNPQQKEALRTQVSSADGLVWQHLMALQSHLTSLTSSSAQKKTAPRVPAPTKAQLQERAVQVQKLQLALTLLRSTAANCTREAGLPAKTYDDTLVRGIAQSKKSTGGQQRRLEKLYAQPINHLKARAEAEDLRKVFFEELATQVPKDINKKPKIQLQILNNALVVLRLHLVSGDPELNEQAEDIFQQFKTQISALQCCRLTEAISLLNPQLLRHFPKGITVIQGPRKKSNHTPDFILHHKIERHHKPYPVDLKVSSLPVLNGDKPPAQFLKTPGIATECFIQDEAFDASDPKKIFQAIRRLPNCTENHARVIGYLCSLPFIDGTLSELADETTLDNHPIKLKLHASSAKAHVVQWDDTWLSFRIESLIPNDGFLVAVQARVPVALTKAAATSTPDGIADISLSLKLPQNISEAVCALDQLAPPTLKVTLAKNSLDARNDLETAEGR